MPRTGYVQVGQPLGLDLHHRALDSIVTLWHGHQRQQGKEGVYDYYKVSQQLLGS